MSDDQVRITQFWQAVEIFSPQQLPKRNSSINTVDIRPKDPMPWEPGSCLGKADNGYIWRHEVYGGVYSLGRVRDALVSAYGQDEDQDPPPKGESALFACTIDDKGFLVEDSAVVSACARAVGRISRGESPVGDFPADAERIANALGTETTVTGADLQEFTQSLASELGVAEILAPRNVRVWSHQVKADRDTDPAAKTFMNSFLTDDLALVAAALRENNAGTALATYLTPDAQLAALKESRIDVQRHPRWVLDECQPDMIPPGRWVSDTGRPLAFSQQFAVNRIMRDHGAGQPGVFAVNGPPGTGKTTMLRDLVAAIVVQRASALSDLSSPAQGFTGDPVTWETDSFTHRIRRLAPNLTGHEIAVTSSSNAAAEYVTAEIPGPNGISGQWRQAAASIDYFTATAQQVTGDGAWALTAAVLGNSANRGAFVTNFWFGGKRQGARTGAGLLDALSDPAQVPDWRGAVATFRQSLTKIQNLSSERSLAAAHLTTLLESRAVRDQAADAARKAAADRGQLESFRGQLVAEYDRADASWRTASAAVKAHRRTRPGLFSGRSARRAWRSDHERLTTALRRAAVPPSGR